MQKLTIITIASIMITVFVCGMFAYAVLNQTSTTDKSNNEGNKSPILGGINSPAYTSNNLQVFIKVDGVTGESTDAQHSGWIEATSFNYSSTGNTVDANTFTVTAETSKATPNMFRSAMSSSTRISKVVIAVQSTNPNGTATDIITWTLANVKLGFSTGFNSADQKAIDTYVMKCETAEVRYKQVDADGKILDQTAASFIFTNPKY